MHISNNKETKTNRKNTIKHTTENEYNTNLLEKPLSQPQKQNIHEDPKHRKGKWATFTYCRKEVRQITKLFQNTQLRVALHTQNTINNILKLREQIDKYNNSGIYQLKCLDCPLNYVGQTGRMFNVRYREHIHAMRTNNSNSGYSNHISATRHAYGTIKDTMDVIKTGRKGRHLSRSEKFHIYKISRNSLHMNDTHIEAHNPIFQAVLELHNK
jgi:hypothetical protein